MKHAAKLMAGALLMLGTSIDSQAADCWGYAQVTYLQKETNRTMRCLEELAEKGHIRAKLNLGVLLQTRGTLLQEGAMSRRGRALVLEAAEAGHIFAQFLASSYARERGDGPARAEYWQWQRTAARQIGWYDDIGDFMESAWLNKYDGKIFREAAKQGDVQAMLYTAYGVLVPRPVPHPQSSEDDEGKGLAHTCGGRWVGGGGVRNRPDVLVRKGRKTGQGRSAKAVRTGSREGLWAGNYEARTAGERGRSTRGGAGGIQIPGIHQETTTGVVEANARGR